MNTQDIKDAVKVTFLIVIMAEAEIRIRRIARRRAIRASADELLAIHRLHIAQFRRGLERGESRS